MEAVEIGTVRQETFASGHSLWAYLPKHSPVWDDHKHRWTCIYSTHAGNIESDLAASDVGWLLENTAVIGAVPGTPAADMEQAADRPADKAAGDAGPPLVGDLAARLAAADQGWAILHRESAASSDYIAFLAKQLDAFEDHASPAAPADDEGDIERMAAAMAIGDGYEPDNEFVETYVARARAALAALREGQS